MTARLTGSGLAEFGKALAAAQPRDRRRRRWIYVPYDQLTDEIGPLAREAPGELGIVLIESDDKARRRPYHQQKLALILANQRHFAIEQARRGVRVRYEVTASPYAACLEQVAVEVDGLRVMRPAERELRHELQPPVDAGAIEILEHEGWLTTRAQFERASPGGPPWRMDRFYRVVRQDSGILMEGKRPVGGKYSFDADNRRPWKGEPPVPDPPRFRPDAITREVGELIQRRFDDHPGRLDLGALPATKTQARRLWSWALDSCMEHFGPFEDAMSTASRGLFHTRVSALLNILRLLPSRVVDDVVGLDIPLSSKEGFVRQVIGWREFVHHVHEATDGFRTLSSDAAPSFLKADEPLPAAFWSGAPSGFHCLDTVVDDVWEEAYGHHITRLMILANIGTLLGVRPRELTDWFWVAYQDAFDWVVEPNVLGMGTFAVGDLMTTKPYVSGAGYIHKMSDYCGACAFDPKKNCPLTRLYWAFLARNQTRLAKNHRLGTVLSSLRRRADDARREDRRIERLVRDRLRRGERLHPDQLS